MARLSCFLGFGRRRKKLKENYPVYVTYKKQNGTLDVEDGNSVKNTESSGLYSNGFSVTVPDETQEKSQGEVKEVVADKHSQAGEEAYEGSDEQDESPSTKRDFSDVDLHTQTSADRDGTGLPLSRNAGESDEDDESFSSKREFSDMDLRNQVSTDRDITGMPLSRNTGSFDAVDMITNNPLNNGSQKYAETGLENIQSGHISDPGMERVEFWASPILKRSCSTLEATGVLRRKADQFPPKKSRSLEDLQNLESEGMDVFDGIHGSPASVMTPCSADKVMLKKHSSSQVLPSRSKRLWWKLFLWSHRNMLRSKMEKPRLLSSNNNSDQRGGYCSDTEEHGRVAEPSMSDSPGSFLGGSRMKNKEKWDNFSDEVSGSWPQNQWVAFSTGSSSLDRVDEWVSSVHHQSPLSINEDDTNDDGIVFPPSPETKGSPIRSTIKQTNLNISEEVSHANSIIQSLNSSATVAHIAGMSLKIIPTISRFSGLRTINLSGNFIAHIPPGSLPKGLHSLNLSRNKIVAIEGLRDLTRLRVLDLSYNRISRIGQGLSNCTLIKELYLAGNKISTVEGLHRLLKLSVLDLSFNKITTTKCLGQLVANYSSLLALNLLGNPVQGNVGDDQLRKIVVGLLPRLAYLNRQAVKPQIARAVAKDSVAKAALGNSRRTSRRKAQKQTGSTVSSASYNHKSNLGGRKNKHSSTSLSTKRK